MKKLGLYIHLPFCERKCSYCVFPVVVTKRDSYYRLYTEKLISEIKVAKKSKKSFDTIYLGGGTPNKMPINYLEEILKELDDLNPQEYTIELNPELVDEFLISVLKKYKINRVSLGAQTFNEKGLEILNRSHTKKDIIKAYNLVYENITKNISLDLIFNYPYQTLKDLKKDLKELLKLRPRHISAYDLIYEDGSKITYLKNKGLIPQDSSDTSYEYFNYIIKTLKKYKYTHYEISSFTKPHSESINNLIYWDLDNYLGLGLGAVSYVNGTEIINPENFMDYISNKPLSELQTKTDLLYRDIIARYFYMGLRKLEGVSIKKIEDMFKISIFSIYPNIQDLIDNGLLIRNDDNLRLSERGLFLGNHVFREFI